MVQVRAALPQWSWWWCRARREQAAAVRVWLRGCAVEVMHCCLCKHEPCTRLDVLCVASCSEKRAACTWLFTHACLLLPVDMPCACAPCCPRRFYSELIKFRRSSPLLGRAEFMGPKASLIACLVDCLLG